MKFKKMKIYLLKIFKTKYTYTCKYKYKTLIISKGKEKKK